MEELIRNLRNSQPNISSVQYTHVFM